MPDVAVTPFIPMEDWGKDHRTTIVYAETRAVDHGGMLDSRHMRVRSSGYPTRLTEGRTVEQHDDYDCLRDAEHAGLLALAHNTVEFTDAGWAYVGKMRRDKAERTFKGFRSPLT